MKKVERRVATKGHLYPVVVQEDISGGYWVNCPVIEGCYSQGETVDEAISNIKEAIEISLEGVKPRSRHHVHRNVSLHFVNV